MSIGLIGIIVALLVFLILTYKGFTTYYVAAIAAIIVAVTNSLNPLTAFIGESTPEGFAVPTTYVGGLITMLSALFSIIFLGVILGKLYADTGAATSIANTLMKAFIKPNQSPEKKIKVGLLVMLIVSGLCTMGGIDAYIQIFTMFPVALIIAEVCDIPRRFVPGMLVLNCAFVAAPGAPQIMNVLAVGALQKGGYEVSATSGLIPGIVAAIIIGVGGYFTLVYMINKDRKKGLHFELGTVPAVTAEEGRKLPNFIVAVLPLVSVFVFYTIIHWNIAIALTIGILVNIALMQHYIPRKQNGAKITGLTALRNTLNAGSETYPGALLMIATPAALAAVIEGTKAFGEIIHGLSTLGFNIMLLAFIIGTVIVLLTGSPPACIMISLGVIMGMAAAIPGLNPNMNLVLRIVVITSITFESLPWNGTILFMQKLAHTNHKQSYVPYFWQTVVWTTVAALAAVVISIAFPNVI